MASPTIVSISKEESTVTPTPKPTKSCGTLLIHGAGVAVICFLIFWQTLGRFAYVYIGLKMAGYVDPGWSWTFALVAAMVSICVGVLTLISLEHQKNGKLAVFLILLEIGLGHLVFQHSGWQ